LNQDKVKSEKEMMMTTI